MILYQQDWTTHPTAIVHTSTTNESFKRMYFVLRDMGIKNNCFFLSLLDPTLEHVDPFDYDHLDPEIVARIALEAKNNPWYYLRELVKVPGVGMSHIDFKLNRSNLFLFWSFYNSVSLVLIQPRQTGKTFGSEALMNHCMHFLYQNSRIKLFTHSTQLIQENIEKFKMIRDGLPTYLIHTSKKDTDNKEEVAYAALKNTYATKTAQHSKVGAFNAGRGGTVIVNQIDEPPFCPNLRISYPVLMNAKNAAIQQAKEAGLPYADLFTTTAGRLDTDSGQYAYSIIQKCLPFTEKLYDLASNAELKYVLEHNSKNNMLYAEFSYRQLGFTKEWAAQVARENNLMDDPAAFARDLENKWTTGSERPGVAPDILEKIDTYKQDPVEISNYEGYLFNWYEKEDDVWSSSKRWFVIGLDTSENINQDFTTVHMLDMGDLSTVMTSRCNDEDLLKLGQYLSDLLIQHPNVTLIPERRSTASMLISIISKHLWDANINPFTRIFNRVFNERNNEAFNKLDVSTRYASEGPLKKYLGYTTSKSGENSRDNLYKLTLNRALKICYQVVKDKSLIQELRALTVNEHGRIDHVVGGHDDAVIAFLLASWFVIYARYQYLYGIPEHVGLSRISSEGDPVDITKQDRQRQLGIRIAELTRQIKGTSNAIIRQNLISEKSFLERQMESLGPLIQPITRLGVMSEEQSSHSETYEEMRDGILSSRVISGREDYRQRFERQVRDPFGMSTRSYWQ